MEVLGISINLNIAICWMVLNEFKLAKHQGDVVMKVDLFMLKLDFEELKHC